MKISSDIGTQFSWMTVVRVVKLKGLVICHIPTGMLVPRMYCPRNSASSKQYKIERHQLRSNKQTRLHLEPESYYYLKREYGCVPSSQIKTT